MNAISSILIQYVDDDRLLKFPIQILYKIVQKYFQNSINKISTYKKNDEKIINFLFKLFGKNASAFFKLIDFKDYKINIIEILMTKYYDIFDFNFVGSALFDYVLTLNNEKRPIVFLETTNSFEKFDVESEKYFEIKNSNEFLLPSIFTNESNINNNKNNSFLNYSNFTIIEKHIKFNENNVLTGINIINDYAYMNNQSLTNIIIPSSVISIGIYSFYKCIYLKTVVIG